jgi:hypothetical protein
LSSAIDVEQIERFARAWFVALDVHAPTEECVRLLADSGLEMTFPEQKLHGVSDFAAWYSGGTYTDGTPAPGVINVFFDETHNLHSVQARISGDEAEVRVVVGWQASWIEPPAPKSKRTSLEAIQDWTIRRSDKNSYGLEIVGYVATAEPFKYAAGFAQL